MPVPMERPLMGRKRPFKWQTSKVAFGSKAADPDCLQRAGSGRDPTRIATSGQGAKRALPFAGPRVGGAVTELHAAGFVGPFAAEAAGKLQAGSEVARSTGLALLAERETANFPLCLIVRNPMPSFQAGRARGRTSGPPDLQPKGHTRAVSASILPTIASMTAYLACSTDAMA